LPLYSLAFYPVKMLWPVGLTPVYDAANVPVMLLATVFTVGVTIFTIVMARKGRGYWLLAWSTYIILILPTVTGLSAGIQPWADRYSYLPSVSIAILGGGVVVALWRYRGNRRVVVRTLAALLVVTVVVLCVYLSREQLRIWRNGETLWRYSCEVTPALPMPYANLGVALEGKGDHDGALAMYSKAVAIQPRYADALYNMGISYEAKEMPDSAAAFYGRAITADRTYTDAYINLGNIMVRAARYDDGVKLYEQAMKLDPSDPDAYYDLGIAMYHKGNKEKALQCFENAVKFSPGYANAYNNMGVVFVDLGNQEAALVSFVRAARLGSQDAQHLLKSKGYTW
jgi:Flp pilus assembly protein TadD